MTTSEAKQLFAYGSWANARMFAAAEALPPAQVEAAVASSFPSVRATLAHIVGAEWIWTRRWVGESPAAFPPWIASAPLAELKSRLASVEAERAAFLAPLTDTDIGAELRYRGTDGKEFSHPLGDLVRHVVNHSTYHRGQLATLLRQLGQTPPSTDFTRWLREGR